LALKNDLENEMDITKELGRVTISLRDDLLFREGSSEIEPEMEPFLMKLGEVMKDGTRLIEMRGFAAHSETVFAPDQEKAAMVLSAKRALAVFRFFQGRLGIEAKRMVAHGFGKDIHVRALEGKKSRMRRQVQIILDFREEIPDRIKRRKRGRSFLDFKGFLFRTPGDQRG
jgi:flagellar motor protein MotB